MLLFANRCHCNPTPRGPISVWRQDALTDFPVFKRLTVRAYADAMRGERIGELCAQLLRAENAGVIETVAANLHEEINEYVRDAHCDETPIVECPTYRAA